MKFLLTQVIILTVLASTGCTSLNSSQKRELSEWKGQDLKVEEKNEALAAGLNVLPGIGDFYNGNVGLGVVNLLFWPASVLWAPIGGATGAEEANYYVTKSHVDTLSKKQQTVLNDLQAAAITKQITEEEFFIASQKVKNMHLKDFKQGISVGDIVPRLINDTSRIPSSLKK
ncbi:MAG TPA: hypothetical protein VNJ01_13815 [Bacteriovoracaceae bacterium]|nr:hypothetical protein [Bacteriovoracaceae bacterium]